MKVKFVKFPIALRLSYNVGDVADIEQKQAELLIQQAKSIEERLEISHSIYKAEINFEPVINGVYHLYQKIDGTQTLSMVAPYEWGKEMPFELFLNTVRLLPDKTWEILA